MIFSGERGRVAQDRVYVRAIAMIAPRWFPNERVDRSFFVVEKAYGNIFFVCLCFCLVTAFQISRWVVSKIPNE